MQKAVVSTVLLLIIFALKAQNGFYGKDGETTHGVEILRQNGIKNAQECKVISINNVEVFTPNDITEYGWYNGSTFVSRSININDTIQQVFLERIEDGELTLFVYKAKKGKHFFVETSTQPLTEITKSNAGESFKDQLISVSDKCVQLHPSIGLVSFNSISLSKYVERYNACKVMYFPHLRYGVSAGYEHLMAKANAKPENKELAQIEFTPVKSFTFGAYIEKPLEASNVALKLAVKYAQYNFSSNRMTETKDIDFVANLSTIRVPFHVRIMYPSNKIRPFLYAGVITSYHFENQTDYYVNDIDDQKITLATAMAGNHFISDLQLGLSGGGGLELAINKRIALYFEAEYNHYSLFNVKDQLQLSGVTFSTGLTF